jgi:hypothetical protein
MEYPSLHAPPLAMPKTGGSALLSPSLPFPAGCEEHHYLQNTNKTQATVCFASLQIRFLLLQVAGRWTMELLVCGRWLKETARWLAVV